MFSNNLVNTEAQYSECVLLGELVLLQLDVVNPEAGWVEPSQDLHQVGQPRVLPQDTHSLQFLGMKADSLRLGISW